MYQNAYTTPQAVINQLEKADSGTMPSEATAAYDEFYTRVKGYCVQVSDWFRSRVHQTFVPYYDAKIFYFDEIIRDRRLRFDTLTLPETLLEIDSITWLGNAVTSSYYRPLSGYRSDRTPYTQIKFDLTGTSGIGGAFTDNITVTGWWGYHSEYSQAYTTIEAVTLANTTATTLAVIDDDAYDTYQYLRIEDELVWITDKPGSNNLTIERGVNGTTAAAHSSQSAQRVNIQPAVFHALTRFVAWAEDNRSNFGTLQFSDGSAVIQAMPKYVQETLESFMTHDLFGEG